jgi:hypothetical protein
MKDKMDSIRQRIIECELEGQDELRLMYFDIFRDIKGDLEKEKYSFQDALDSLGEYRKCYLDSNKILENCDENLLCLSEKLNYFPPESWN